MKVEVKLAPSEFTKTVLVVERCVLSENLIKVEQRSLFHAIFDEKDIILKCLSKFLANKQIKIDNNNTFLFLKIKSTTTSGKCE